jgi:hypothetical protein
MNNLHCGRMTDEPEPWPRRWALREIAAAVGVAAVIAAFGGAAIYAATEGSSHSFGARHQAVGPGGGKPGGPGGPGGQLGAVGGPGPAARRCMASSWYPTAPAATPRN